MIRLVNRLTGTEMWVHGSRLKEYLAAGHVPAAAPKPEQEPEPKKTAPKKTKGAKKGG
jgi:hypothetical protein